MTVISKRRTRSLLAVAIAFLILQFVRPNITNPPVTAELRAPPEVKQILRNSCYNCHSNETKLAWFDQIVPVYWIVANDVKQARRHLNFSEIGAKPILAQKGLLYEAVNEIQLGAMPLPSYQRLHPKAAVTPAQLAVLQAYLNKPTMPTPTMQANVDPAGESGARNSRSSLIKDVH